MAESSSQPRSKLSALASRVRSSIDQQRHSRSHSHGVNNINNDGSLLGEPSTSERDFPSGHSAPHGAFGTEILRSPSLNNTDDTHGRPEMVSYNDDELLPPNVPYADSPRRRNDSATSSRRSSFSSLKEMVRGGSSGGGAGGSAPASIKERPASLSVNYVPAKFTARRDGGLRARNPRKGGGASGAPAGAKVGGGRDAFAKNAQRMGDMGTVDDDEGVVFQLGKGGLQRKNKPKLRWNRFKFVLFAANCCLIVVGLATLISAILVWLNVFYSSDVIRVGNHDELVVSTVAAAVIVLTSLIGFSGIMLNNRPFLAVYTFMLWICLGLIVAPGYMTYKQRTFNLEGKLNLQWSRILGTQGRLRIQDALRCCGYYSPQIEATISPLCYSRSNLPGCKGHYLRVERRVLDVWYIVSFALVPLQLAIIIAGLLCSNHITYRFGKGLTPKRYRLDMGTMAVIMDEYASQIAAQYGDNLAAEALTRSSAYLSADHQATSPFHDSFATASGVQVGAGLSKVVSRAGSTMTTNTTGYNSQAGDPLGVPRTTTPSKAGLLRPPSGAALFDLRRDSIAGSGSDAGSIIGWSGTAGAGTSLGPPVGEFGRRDSRYSDAPEERRSMDSASRFGTMASEDARERDRDGSVVGSGYAR